MSVMINLNDLHSHCCVCLRLIQEESEAVRTDDVHQHSGLTVLELLVETLLDSSTLKERPAAMRGAVCQMCCRTLQDFHQFRSQCTEIYKLYETLLHTRDSRDEEQLLKLLEEDPASSLRSHLFRLGIISPEDISGHLFLCGIDFFKNEYVEEIAFDSSGENATELALDGSPSSGCKTPEDEIVQESADSDSCEDEPLAEIKRRRLCRKTEESQKYYAVCPAKDCRESLDGQKYASHLKESHRYGCKQCGLILSSKYTMGKHTTIHVKLPSTVKCTFCERMFSNLAKMRAHARDVHLKQALNYECEECGEKFEKRKLLNSHCDTHLPKDCSVCKAKFDHPNKLFYHVKKSHPEQLLSCEHCARKFVSQSKLDRHRFEHSENSVPEDGYELLTLKSISFFVCNLCEKQFTSNDHRSAHMTSHDPASRPKIRVTKRSKEELNKLEKKYQCDQCDASYRLPTSLDSHMKTHSAAPFVCDICGSFFKAKSYLKQHVTYRHSRDFRYFCDFCPKACATSSDLLRHRRVHTNERPYQCDQCEARFKTNDGYRKHLRSHSGEKIYRCDLCERRFMCHSSLKTHKIAHTNEKAFKCFHCEQHFNVPKNRRRHILRAHPGLPTKQPATE